jgi:sodium transport system permease protein
MLTLGACMFMLSRVPLEELGLTITLGGVAVIGILAATLPLALMAAGLQILVASFARSFKEAQTYLSLLMLLPMLPSFVASLWELGDEPWMIPIPALGQQVLLSRVIGGESAAGTEFALAGLSALVMGLVCVWLTARLFRRESIIFGR